ncbi:MAG: hypothetical protein IT582_10660 [Opitutaceae bacterium]|nr:hypothetical protein [Opitutaceae bacterium]
MPPPPVTAWRRTPNIEARYALDGAEWLWHPALRVDENAQVVFRLNFRSARAEKITLQVSADQVFALALDGALIGRGPDTGEAHCWSFNTYEITLKPGAHRLEAWVWWAKAPVAPTGRATWRGGFVCAGLGEAASRFTTGQAPWRVARVAGVAWSGPLQGFYHVLGGGARMEVAAITDSLRRWEKPVSVRHTVTTHECGGAAPGWQLQPAHLPEQRHDGWRGGRVRCLLPSAAVAEKIRFGGEADERAVAGWDALLRQGKPLRLPAGYEATLLIDTDDYLCGYARLEVSGGAGAELHWRWAEALYETENTSGPKGPRNVVAGKWFYGFGDSWVFDGRHRWLGTPWWRSGRFWRIDVKVGARPLVLRALAVERTGYPLRIGGKFACDDPSLEAVQRMGERGLQSCMHEVYVDCPYYEQLMYVADTRVQMLINHALSGDDRLVRRGIELFDWSRGVNGFVRMHYPSSIRQESATFAMIWPWMLHDYALWRDDAGFARKHLPGMRALLEGLTACADGDGLLGLPPGWLFVDWVPAWPAGWAPGVREGRLSALVNLHWLRTLQCAADLETWHGEAGLATRWRRAAGKLAKELPRRFWSARRGLWADDDSHGSFSQHAQALAVLAGLRAPALKKWFGADAPKALHRATIYFQHYVFDALGRIGRGGEILPALDGWRDLVALDLKTPLESEDKGRSDCHAWGAHPLYHLRATIAGVRPMAPGFARVRIAPQPGALTAIDTVLPHPGGEVKLRAKFAAGRVDAEVALPRGISGEFVWRGTKHALRPGRQRVRM